MLIIFFNYTIITKYIPVNWTCNLDFVIEGQCAWSCVCMTYHTRITDIYGTCSFFFSTVVIQMWHFLLRLQNLLTNKISSAHKQNPFRHTKPLLQAVNFFPTSTKSLYGQFLFYRYQAFLHRCESLMQAWNLFKDGQYFSNKAKL